MIKFSSMDYEAAAQDVGTQVKLNQNIKNNIVSCIFFWDTLYRHKVACLNVLV